MEEKQVSAIVAETPEDIPESVSCEGSAATLVIQARTSADGMAVNFPGGSLNKCSASCTGGVLKVSSSEEEPVSQEHIGKFNISFGIPWDAEPHVTADVAVPEVPVFNRSDWQDAKVFGYISGSATLRMGFSGEAAVLLYALDEGEQA